MTPQEDARDSVERKISEWVCVARNEWESKHERNWLEDHGEQVHPDDYIGKYIADRLAALSSPSGAVAWDEGSPCMEPRPVGMVYPPKPKPRASGYLPDGSGVEWNAYDTAQMEAYARTAYADGFASAPAPAAAPQGVGGGDGFIGDNAKLIGCIEALLSLDAAGALVPHGVGGHARTLLTAAASRLGRFT